MDYFNLFCIIILFAQSSIFMNSIHSLKKDIELVARNPNLARKTFKQRNDKL